MNDGSEVGTVVGDPEVGKLVGFTVGLPDATTGNIEGLHDLIG
jgi:hypothetical protein